MKQIIPGISGFPLSVATKLRCADPEAAEDAVGSFIEPRQFVMHGNPRATNIRISHVAIGLGHLFGASHGTALTVNSSPIRSYQVMIPLRGELRRKTGRGEILARPGSALVYSPGDCLDTYWSEQCVSLVLSVPAERLCALARLSCNGADSDRMPLEPLMRLDTGSGRSFANTLGLIAQESVASDSAFSRGITARMLEQTLLLSLLSAQLPATAGSAERPPRGYLLRALNVIEQRCEDDIGIADIAQDAGVSVRTLQYGFADRFGVGPVSYLKQYRLRKIHDTLRSASPASCAVGDIAARWGFYHGSAFARSYRKLFGELPSQTLASRD
jgi:AraC-like DNA-binding protein